MATTARLRAEAPAPGSGMSRSLVALFTFACALGVADDYYAQPLLHTISHDLQVSPATAGTAVTVTQLGYAAGLVLLVPLGDLVSRRRLIVPLLTATTVALVVTAVAPGIGVLCGALAVVGFTNVISQILVPLAATLSKDSERGRVVGAIQSGVLLGALLGRTVAGLLAEALDWRGVYLIAAAVTVAVMIALRLRIPHLDPPAAGTRYPALLYSVVTLIRTHPLLRRRMIYGALTFCSFNALWTTISYLLSAPPYRYSQAVIGLFGLVGLVGALTARRSGALADRGWSRTVTGASFGLLIVSWALLAWGQAELGALLTGIVVLDAAVQGVHIQNQQQVYTLDARARSRLSTAYVTSYFIGGAIGSSASAALWGTAGWAGVTFLGGGAALAGFLLWLTELPHVRAPLSKSTREA